MPIFVQLYILPAIMKWNGKYSMYEYGWFNKTLPLEIDANSLIYFVYIVCSP